ncbi:MAG: TIGR01621 family pseudouridine synthase [Cellvibrionaceae bacterium]
MYELIDSNADFLVVNKQSGVSVHDEDGCGLIKQLRNDLSHSSIVPVHRLDKATSGLLLCAKNNTANRELSQLFQHRKIEKYYLALSNKKPSKKQGLIVGDMERTRKGSWKLCKTRDNPAITQFFSYGLGDGQRLFVLKPHTGKTHQLRVALKSIGAPIMGDLRYNSIVKSETNNDMSLHAYSLRFVLGEHAYSYVCLPTGTGFTHSATQYVKEQLNEPWGLSWPKVTVSTVNKPQALR